MAFSGSDVDPPTRVVTETVAHLGPRNHVIFGLAPVEGGFPQALISIKTDRIGLVNEQILQIPYRGYEAPPENLFRSLGLSLADGWDILRWKADDFVAVTAPSFVRPQELVSFAVGASALLLEADPDVAWELRFVG
ncbi:MAG: hypothetical protein WD269_11770 [Acidimicrobiia bacterium]